MTRAPVFWFSCVEDAASFYDLLPGLFSEFRDAAQSTSRHARLVKIEPHIVGSTVHVIFEYYCGNAAGQNMVTFATQNACDRFAASNTALAVNLRKITIDGQLISEKSLSWGNILHSRGVAVMAWGKEAATRNGQLGYSVNQANVVAAMFIACGQDAASVAESAWSHLAVEFDRETEELGVSTYFPSLPVGTVGGGTTLDTQREALELLGCTGPGSKGRLAGLIASFALALDISTAAAIGNNTFATSHYKLGRSTRGSQSKL
ncbi:hydroxymethylglutaryl-coenzyme A reductase family protein [Penicillium frequentans]|uniref:hydroxymethylglutaryl-CoA reductase (NADPH) n=1 Tax=Penicillium frequentans TaxID=3151616 RepID=A0AAD6CZ17_9EURO|nr:hydroxymethylglutaryl-coenzyme A reductase family protein [Penicillium glabrum]